MHQSHLLSPRWPGGRSWLTEGAGSVHQRHTVRNPTEAAYARSDLFERRRRLMDDWAAYLWGTRTCGGVMPVTVRRRRGRTSLRDIGATWRRPDKEENDSRAPRQVVQDGYWIYVVPAQRAARRKAILGLTDELMPTPKGGKATEEV